ncbi:hypothetical protein ACFXP3_11925 [Streptomyces sp. NPDC059096]|uniref:hypothetical protein n=1 Tax=unclassified Streptomyces TaxID=2593676 RepID=UPI00369B0361
MSEHDVSEPPTVLSAPAPAAPASPTAVRTAHTASTVERGSFCLARCTCGWSGPARRARDRARADAAAHTGESGRTARSGHPGDAPPPDAPR